MRRAAAASARGPWPRGLTSGPLGGHQSLRLQVSTAHPGLRCTFLGYSHTRARSTLRENGTATLVAETPVSATAPHINAAALEHFPGRLLSESAELQHDRNGRAGKVDRVAYRARHH